MTMPLQQLVDDVADGQLPVALGRVFGLDQIVAAHQYMEANTAHGKIVVLTR